MLTTSNDLIFDSATAKAESYQREASLVRLARLLRRLQPTPHDLAR